MAKYADLNKVLDIAMGYIPDDDGSCSNAGCDLREMLDEFENMPTINLEPARHIEMIVDYLISDGPEYIYCDNHGILRRCCDHCRHYVGVYDCKGVAPCEYWNKMVKWDDYCSYHEREEDRL